jgi:hypothetical protein
MTLDTSVTQDAISMLRKSAKDLENALKHQTLGNEQLAEKYRVSAVANAHAALARVAQ